MKRVRLIGFALGASLALAGSAFGQDIAIGVAGPMTGGEATFGKQMKDGAELAVARALAAALLAGACDGTRRGQYPSGPAEGPHDVQEWRP